LKINHLQLRQYKPHLANRVKISQSQRQFFATPATNRRSRVRFSGERHLWLSLHHPILREIQQITPKFLTPANDPGFPPSAQRAKHP
jgi:hypothetical protein